MQLVARALRFPLAVSCAAILAIPARADNGKPPPAPVHVIIMVADGMGLADVTAARVFRNGPAGAPLALETLDHVGYQRTYSASSLVTDSAAGASAWACGEKFANGEICRHAATKHSPPSLLDLAHERGMATGLVATSTITHATPAAFGAHANGRTCEQEIARQYLEVSKVDLLLGGGAAIFDAQTPDRCGVSGDRIAEARSLGYVVARTARELDAAVRGGAPRLLGLFAAQGMTRERARKPDSAEPHLADMARAALSLLEKDPDGFFLMMEGSQIDWANHDNDAEYQLHETLAFDDAVAATLKWIAAQPERRASTLLIVLPDHETGGFAINGPDRPVTAGAKLRTAWTTRGHTATDVPVWSQGPGSERLAHAIENTFVYQVARDLIDGRGAVVKGDIGARANPRSR